jgi:zeaxanthin epoxidase
MLASTSLKASYGHVDAKATPLGAPAFSQTHQHTRICTSRPRSHPRVAASVHPKVLCKAVEAPSSSSTHAVSTSPKDAPLKVVIVGGGIGGLVLATGLLKKGYQVQVLERDLTAIRGEGKYRGPIQVQSNALAALEALDEEAAELVLEEGCITGDRINGLCDGLTGDWYCKFDTFHPAVDNGLPVTRVIGRYTLQQILADRVRTLGGDDVITNGVHIMKYENHPGYAKVIAEDGREFTGDLIVGADGIRSKIRFQMVGESEATYSQYTCYTGISNFTPPDIDTVAYRVFLGNRQYFVSSDVGGGKMQWYAFHQEPAGGTDKDGHRKERLMEIFGDWSDKVTDLIMETPEEDVLRRDIYDRPPIFKWTDGRVALLGDSAHAMQPNLGQGGCMAIEDAFQLATDLTTQVDAALEQGKSAKEVDIEGVLKGYFNKRVVRAATIQGMAGMAAGMASTYKAYLGEGLGPLEAMTKLKIPHPGRVSGQVIIKYSMPGMFDFVLGGYKNTLAANGWRRQCRIDDKPQGFDQADFDVLLRDDDALLRAMQAHWLLQPAALQNSQEGTIIPRASSSSSSGLVVGRGQEATVSINSPSVSATHARLEQQGEDYFITDLNSQYGTYLNDRQLTPGVATRLMPSDNLQFGLREDDGHNLFRIKLRHVSLAESGHGEYEYKARKSVDVSGRDRELAAWV